MRTYRDLWLWLGAAFLALFAAFVAIGLAYFTKEDHFSFYTSWEAWASLVVFAAAFGCFFSAIRGWPFPPGAKQKFPDIFFEVYGGSALTTTYTFPNGMEKSVPLAGYKVRITNLEHEQNANLTIDAFLKLDPGPEGGFDEAILFPLDWPLDPKVPLKSIDRTIVLGPGTTISGDLVYETSMVGGYGPLASPPSARFRIFDHISNEARDVIMEGSSLGKFGRNDMVSSRGGAEIVKPQAPPPDPNASHG
jgi:hypothetical protein